MEEGRDDARPGSRGGRQCTSGAPTPRKDDLVTTRTRITGRHEEAARVRSTLRAAAMGRLLLGEFQDWGAFLEPETTDFVAMPRRQLKALDDDARRRLSKEVGKFCNENFRGMTVTGLNRPFEAVKAGRGIEVPRPTFEKDYAPFQQARVKGTPRHATVVLSLWGLQFWFPEQQLANDLTSALVDAGEAMKALGPHYRARHRDLLDRRDEVGTLMKRRSYAARSGLLTAFNLLECHMNSVAWAFLKASATPPVLSNGQRKTLEDSGHTKFRDKLLKYQEIIAGTPLPAEAQKTANSFLDVVKPFRDSLVHPSPFETPQQFGGHDKLRMVYRVDVDTLFLAAGLLVDFIERLQKHLGVDPDSEVPWLEALRGTVDAHAVLLMAPEWRHR